MVHVDSKRRFEYVKRRSPIAPFPQCKLCLFGFLVGEFQFSALRAPTLVAAPFGYNLWKTKHWDQTLSQSHRQARVFLHGPAPLPTRHLPLPNPSCRNSSPQKLPRHSHWVVQDQSRGLQICHHFRHLAF
ncbi:uncharacterized protein LOC126595327 [Malus sylvestris]|uniref:uncharacterized protein LOC126595327 n=1 Tax=Malus sylvestris TaxID=3752 RepID=UPI0021AC556C|nr:uncharacterized protein LOC126595327 [Malus sylvestris]